MPSNCPFPTLQPRCAFWRACACPLLPGGSLFSSRENPSACPGHEGPYGAPPRPDPCQSLSLAATCPALLSTSSAIKLLLVSGTHCMVSYICAFAHVGCAAWNTSSISLHLGTIYFLNSVQRSPPPGSLPGCPDSASGSCTLFLWHLVCSKMATFYSIEILPLCFLSLVASSLKTQSDLIHLSVSRIQHGSWHNICV